MKRMRPMVAFLLLWSIPLSSDIVLLKDGSRHQGKILLQDMQIVRIRTAIGIVEFARDDVRDIILEGDDPDRAGQVAAYGPLDGMWRSALIPSWGQFHMGYNAKGCVIAGAAAVALAGMLVSRFKFSGYEDRYQALPYYENDPVLYGRVREWRNRFNLYALVYAGIWLLNVADAGFFRPGSRAQPAESPAFLADGILPLVQIRF